MRNQVVPAIYAVVLVRAMSLKGAAVVFPSDTGSFTSVIYDALKDLVPFDNCPHILE